MICKKCHERIDLVSGTMKETCPHCGFYFYLQTLLRFCFIAHYKVQIYEDVYFAKVHSKIYDPFIKRYDGPVNEGAQEIISIYIAQFKDLIKGYAKEELLFIALALKEISAWSIPDPSVWESTRIRTVSHIFTNLINMTDDEVFGDIMIVDEMEFIEMFVICEEVGGISSNINLVDYFNWDVNLEDMLKTKVENARLEWFHNYYEVKEIAKPEEINFNENPLIERYLNNRKLTVDEIRKQVGEELSKLLGFNFEDLNLFRECLIEIAKENEQIFEFSLKINNTAMTSYFIFDEQLEKITLQKDKISKILDFFTYQGMEDRSYKYKSFTNPHMDYKFIIRFENIISFGEFDSENSITIFENIAVTDHFVEEFYGRKATTPFKKAQERIALLMAYKIASHYMNKKDYFVPLVESNIPYVNVKSIIGNGIRKKLVNDRNQDLGDIDVIVINTHEKKILIFEIKFYKPAVELTEVLTKDKKIFDDVEKILKRANWIKNNQAELVAAWGLENTEYSVETVLVTGRPNYFGKEIEKDSQGSIRYLTFDEVLRL